MNSINYKRIDLIKKAIWLFAGGPMQASAAKKIKDDGLLILSTLADTEESLNEISGIKQIHLIY